ncbi:MAG: lipid II:glycine glycyltransferase FemX [Bacteroidota bacterium]
MFFGTWFKSFCAAIVLFKFAGPKVNRIMHCKLEEIEIRDIEATNVVQQTSFWARVKNLQGLEPFAFEYAASEDLLKPAKSAHKFINDDLLVLVRYIDEKHSIAYIPYGPVDEPDFENQGLFMEELAEALRPHLPKNCILIRFDLPWENQWAHEDDFFDERGNWKGPPSANQQEFRVNFKTNNWNLQKSQSDNLPTNTIFLDLNQGQDSLLKNMKSKTRYNIRLSKRRGVQVKSYGKEMLEPWYDLYRETSMRNGITLHPKENFYDFFEIQKNAGKDIDTHLLMADYEGEFLAAMFLVLSKKRGTYLYGASSANRRNLMATYAVQWEGIRLAQEAGCEEYDMFGAAPNANSGHPMHGLYRFKSGFGGSFFHRMGCWDYPLNQTQYNAFRAQEVNSQGYHVN